MNTVVADKAVLYSFRRCPYAIRTRMALAYAGIDLEIREISFKNKPKAMLSISPKGTVPVLQLSDGRVLDESRQIIAWALSVNDSQNWYFGREEASQVEIAALIDDCDGEFKSWLDKYKYSVAYPEHTPQYYREKGTQYLQELERRLEKTRFLFGAQRCLADIAIFPFVRQFAYVDKDWFDESSYYYLKSWLQLLLTDPLFVGVMQKHPLWNESAD